MTQPLRIGIAGLGFGAQVYVPAVNSLAEAQLCALAKRELLSGEPAIVTPYPVRLYAGGLAMIKEAGLDCIIVATPPEAQAEVVLQALLRKIAVLCEKPCGATLEQCAELAVAANKADTCVGVGFQYRYEPGIAGLIELVQEGEIGTVRKISVTWRTRGGLEPRRLWSWRDDVARGGGVLNEYCAHVFDYLALMSGDAIDRVHCIARTVVSERRNREGKRIPVLAPDCVEFRCVSESGVLMHACISNAWPEMGGHHIEVQGDRGTARFEHVAPFSLGSASLAVEVEGKLSTRPLLYDKSFVGSDSRCPAVVGLLRDFLQAVRGESRRRFATIPDCLAARQCIKAAELSNASGQWVMRQQFCDSAAVTGSVQGRT